MRTRNPVSAMVSEKFIIVDVSLHKPRLPHIPFAQGFPFRAHVDFGFQQVFVLSRGKW